MLTRGRYGLVVEGKADLTGQLGQQLFFELIGGLCRSVSPSRGWQSFPPSLSCARAVRTLLRSIGANLTGNRRGSFTAGGRRDSGIRDLIVSLRIAARTRVGTREMLRRLSLELLVISMDNRGKIVDGDVNAGVRDSSKG